MSGRRLAWRREDDGLRRSERKRSVSSELHFDTFSFKTRKKTKSLRKNWATSNKRGGEKRVWRQRWVMMEESESWGPLPITFLGFFSLDVLLLQGVESIHQILFIFIVLPQRNYCLHGLFESLLRAHALLGRAEAGYKILPIAHHLWKNNLKVWRHPSLGLKSTVKGRDFKTPSFLKSSHRGRLWSAGHLTFQLTQHPNRVNLDESTELSATWMGSGGRRFARFE